MEHPCFRKTFEDTTLPKRQIVNIVNFIRAVEPRLQMDLIKPIREQITLMKKHHLRGTFLLQYDALLVPEIVELVRSLDHKQFELGVWHEIVQPMTEACGIPWTGRYSWDWHTHCGFSVGYTKSQREQLSDALFEKFNDIFGYYPRVFGSWLFDTHTIRYITEKYPLDAICNCKEQYGTDGYTLWGGYYGQAYYPGNQNVFMPAQSLEQQITVPLFRMLGADPVYQYDLGMDPGTGAPLQQSVATLEPVYKKSLGGGIPGWVDWYLRENFNGECLTFGYTQAGQENSFGWDAMAEGLKYQFARFEELQKEGKICVEPIGESGRWFKEEYAVTPASSISAHSAYQDDHIQTVWYSSRFYRLNLYNHHGQFRIRDFHIFNQAFADPFENTVCETNEATYEALPVIDGNRHSGNGALAGIRLCHAETGEEMPADDPIFHDGGNGMLTLDFNHFSMTLTENSFSVCAPHSIRLCSSWGNTEDHFPLLENQDATTMRLSYKGCQYTIILDDGIFENAYTVRGDDGKISCRIDN